MKTVLQQLNYQPHSLTADEIEHPKPAIAEYFENHSLQVTRENLWKFYQSWIYQNADTVNAETQKEMIFFYTRLIDLVSLSYVVGFE